MATMAEIYRRSKATNELFYNLRLDGMTYVEIGEMMGVTASWAGQRVKRYHYLIRTGVVKDVHAS
jgi:DNA-binding Lrp family transcriptional regulator